MEKGTKGFLGYSLRTRPRVVIASGIAIAMAGVAVFTAKHSTDQTLKASLSPANLSSIKASQVSPGKATVVAEKQEQASVTTPATTVDSPFQRFAVWAERYKQSDAQTRATLINEGIKLGELRREALKALIQTDPKTALAQALTDADRQNLPAAVSTLLETQVSGIGNYYLDCLTPRPGQPEAPEQLRRSVTLNGTNFFAYVYGPMMQQPSLEKTAIEGVSLDDQLALRDTSSYGGKAWGGAAVGSSELSGRPDMAWTHGPKKVLMIRVDFSDLPGEPIVAGFTNAITPDEVTSLFNSPDGIRNYFAQTSYSNTDLLISASDVSPVYRLPHTAAYYSQGNGYTDYSGQIRDDALAIAGTNYDLGQYDRLGVVCSDLSKLPGSRMTYAGVANIYSKNFLINGYWYVSVVAHEIGHTYGVFHANWWKPANHTTIGTETDLLADFYNGAIGFISQEYGDQYDLMGSGIDIHHHFNPWFKNILGWIPDNSVRTVTSPGTYRVYRFDDPGANYLSNTMALKISRDILRDYWIGYRRQVTNGVNLANGAYIEFGYQLNRNSDLLVCNNPGVNEFNAALEVGQSLIDTNAGVTITTVAQGGTAPNEYLDIQVALQPRLTFSNKFVFFETTTNAATVTVYRLGGASGVTTATYASVDGTAISGTNYIGDSGTLTWADGDTTPRVLTFPMFQYPASLGETRFTVILTNIVNGVLINPGTITVSLRPPGNCDNNYLADVMDGLGGGGISSLEVQPDGTMLVGGLFTSIGRGKGEISPAVGHFGRLLADGSRDYTFDSGIGATEPFSGVETIRRQPNGKILLGGSFHNLNNLVPAMPNLARVNANGSLDTTFHPPSFDGPVHRLVVQPDGRIVVAGGFRNVGGQACLGVCRLFPDGSVDFRYNGNYYMGTDINDVVLDNYGSANEVRILFVGGLQTKINPRQWMQAIRLHADGTEDNSFRLVTSDDVNTIPHSLAVQPDGKVLVGGQTFFRVNGNGSPDPTFNTSFTGNGLVRILSILVQPDGKVVVGGIFSTVNAVTNNNLIRLTSTGALDPTWDNGTGSANGANQYISALALRPDGRLVAASPSMGNIRGPGALEGAFLGTIYGVTSQALFSGITNLYGVGTFTASNAAVGPGGTAAFTVQRVNGSSGAVQLDYSTQDGTAIRGTDYVATQGTLGWADGDTTPRTVVVTCNSTAIPGRTFNLNLALPRAGIQLGLINQATVTVQYNYAAWAAQNFTAQQLTNAIISGITATPAGDGVANLLKYALGLSPFTPSATNVPIVTIKNDRLQMVFNRNPLAMDLTYEVQASSDIGTGIWSPLARSIGGGPTANISAFSVFELPNGSFLNVTVQDTNKVSTTAARYFRLKVTK
ncbi:Calx-beta domain-containing protein [Pedosphaera parvula]|uniref:Calx-beta domain-containing protein n=1 Tax=Pedosphaera parvula (strain Ellin514) TaxID=320771 RepID=B9X9P6_PEDPL|nr:Calx-beta domain-containing protein [Pedosphaera parvula]EEF63217.1 hypothetical protein Cflav_PD5852 [Pedosphaera parvula Ellin514]